MAKFLNYTNKDGVNDSPFNYAKARTGGYPYITKDGGTPATSKFWLNYTNRNGSVYNGNHFNYNRVQNITTALTYDKKKKRDFSDYDGWIYYEYNSSNTFLFYIEDGNMYRTDSGYVENYDGDGYRYTITDAGIREYNDSEYGVDGGAEKIQFSKQGEILMAETEEEKDLLYDYIVNEVYRANFFADKDVWKEVLANPLIVPVRSVPEYYSYMSFDQIPSFTEIVKKNPGSSSSDSDLDLSDVTDIEGRDLVPKEDHVYYIGNKCFLYDGEKLKYACHNGYGIYIVLDIDENGHVIETDKIKYYHENKMHLYKDRYFGPESELHNDSRGNPYEISACIAKGKALEIYEDPAPVCFSLMPVDVTEGVSGAVVRNEVINDYNVLTYNGYRLNKVYNPENIKLDIPVNLPITSDIISGKKFKSRDGGGLIFYSDGTGKWILGVSEDENGNLVVGEYGMVADVQWSISDGELTGKIEAMGQSMDFVATFDGNLITLTLEGVGMEEKFEKFDGEIIFDTQD